MLLSNLDTLAETESRIVLFCWQQLMWGVIKKALFKKKIARVFTACLPFWSIGSWVKLSFVSISFFFYNFHTYRPKFFELYISFKIIILFRYMYYFVIDHYQVVLFWLIFRSQHFTLLRTMQNDTVDKVRDAVIEIHC